MRYLSATVLLVFGWAAQASPATSYRALKHLGFDNKQIAKIVTGVASQTNDNEVYVLITKKFKDVSSGYQFSQKKSGELVMQKIDIQSGKLTMGQQEIIDPNLTDQRLIEQQANLLQLLQGVIDHNNNRKVADVVNDLKKSLPTALTHLTPQQKFRLSQQQWMLSSLFSDALLDTPTQIKYLFEILDVQKKDIAQKLSLPPHYVSVYRKGVIPRDTADMHGINKRHLLTELLHEQTDKKVATSSYDSISSDDADKIHNLINEIYYPNTATKAITINQQLLSPLFNDRSLNNSAKIKYLFEILDVRKTDLSKKFSLLPYKSRSPYVNSYMNGAIPRDTVDIHGINKRHLLKELLHERVNEKVAASFIDSDDAQKIHALIDKILYKAPNRHRPLLSLLFTDESLDNSEKIKLMSKILNVRIADIADKLSLPPGSRSATASGYKNGHHIPHDKINIHGINRRQLLKELYHEKVDTSSFDSSDADKLHDLIDEVWPTGTVN